MPDVNADGRNARALRNSLRGLRTATLANFAEVAAEQLCAHAGYAKSMFSWVNGPAWAPEAISIHPAVGEEFPELVQAIDGSAVLLAHAPREAELVRRRRGYSLDHREYHLSAYRPLLDLSHPVAYAAAPIITGDRVIGMVHADRHIEEVGAGDIELLSVYAQLCGLAYTRLVQRQRLAAQRAALAHAVAESFRQPGAGEIPPPAPDHGTAVAAESGNDEPGAVPVTTRVRQRLTDRELDVLRCIAEGASNATIAHRLFISDGTVKSHVQHIYRKLGVVSRAQAAARYRALRQDSATPV